MSVDDGPGYGDPEDEGEPTPAEWCAIGEHLPFTAVGESVRCYCGERVYKGLRDVHVKGGLL